MRDSYPRGEERVASYAEQAIKALLTDRPIAYHPVLARAVKSVTGGIFLSQLLYWTPRSHDPDGWVRKTQEEITDETALTRREQETARDACKKAGVLTWTLRGIPAKLHYRVDIQTLAKLLAGLPPQEALRPHDDGDDGPQEPMAELPPERPSSRPPADKQGRRNPPTKFGGKRQTGLHDPANQRRIDPPSSDGGSGQTITEIRSEITTETLVVVDALRARGMTETVARRLAATLSPEYILAKCDLLDWLVERRHRSVGQNPAGYLRRAIEQDYAAPPGYKSLAQRAAEAAEHAAAIAAEEEELRQQAAEEARAHQLDLASLRHRYPPQAIPGTDLTTDEAWARTLDRLEGILSGPNFEMFVKHTILLRCDGQEAEVGARSAFDAENLRDRLDRHISHVLGDVLGRRVQCTYVSLTKLQMAEDAPPSVPAARSVGLAPASAGGRT